MNALLSFEAHSVLVVVVVAVVFIHFFLRKCHWTWMCISASHLSYIYRSETCELPTQTEINILEPLLLTNPCRRIWSTNWKNCWFRSTTHTSNADFNALPREILMKKMRLYSLKMECIYNRLRRSSDWNSVLTLTAFKIKQTTFDSHWMVGWSLPLLFQCFFFFSVEQR